MSIPFINGKYEITMLNFKSKKIELYIIPNTVNPLLTIKIVNLLMIIYSLAFLSAFPQRAKVFIKNCRPKTMIVELSSW